MKGARTPDPERWRDRGADAHALEARAAALSEAAASVQPLAPAALSRIRSAIAARRSRRGPSGVFAAAVRHRLAFGVGLLVLCAATAGGAGILWRRYVASPRSAAPAPAEPLPRHAPRRATRPPTRLADQPASIAVPATAPAPAPVEEPPAHVEERALARERPAPAAIAPAPRESSLRSPDRQPPVFVAPPAPAAPVTEAALVAEALSNLRQRNDARAALAALDRYARAFPRGILEAEALRTRVEAVIRLGDMTTALALLDGRAAAVDALGPDLVLTRAELRAAAGRFREALADFTQLIEGAGRPLAKDGDERALYGRAVCLGRLGQHERARVDLLAHQTRFPGGRFAAEVERLLSGKE